MEASCQLHAPLSLSSKIGTRCPLGMRQVGGGELHEPFRSPEKDNLPCCSDVLPVAMSLRRLNCDGCLGVPSSQITVFVRCSLACDVVSNHVHSRLCLILRFGVWITPPSVWAGCNFVYLGVCVVCLRIQWEWLVKVKVRLTCNWPRRPGGWVEVLLYSFFNLGAIWG
jgi:hypothetical protein